MINGSDGIPLTGKVEEYATEMWLADPSAFWLHPEGPLSDTTPDEWRAKQVEEERQRLEAERQRPINPYANAFSTQNGLFAHYQAQMSSYHSQLGTGLSRSPLSSIFGNFF